jgi:hypothetical protein
MIAIHLNKVNVVLAKYKDKIEEQRKSALAELKAINQNFNQAEKQFLENVVKEFEKQNFLAYTPDEIDKVVNKLGDVPKGSLMKNGKSSKMQLTHYIQKALGYNTLRATFYPMYFYAIGIKSCVYCNSQLTICLQGKGSDIQARFEVDHYYSKSKYPYLSVSLFNLYPCCASCNKRKSDKKIEFKLYSSDEGKVKQSDYKFSLSPKSKCSFLLTKSLDFIEIDFEEPAINPSYQSLQESFKVKEIHETQRDIIGELIIKSQIYNDSFKEALYKNFSKLSLSDKDFERVIVGNYTEEKHIHKRPFSKMMMDIAKQLNIIK